MNVSPDTEVLKRIKELLNKNRGDLSKVRGITPVDDVALRHDINYALAKDLKDIRKADIRMVKDGAKANDHKYNKIGAAAIAAKVGLEAAGILDPSKFAGFKKLSPQDETLLLKVRKNLDQHGLGIKSKIKKAAKILAAVIAGGIAITVFQLQVLRQAAASSGLDVEPPSVKTALRDAGTVVKSGLGGGAPKKGPKSRPITKKEFALLVDAVDDKVDIKSFNEQLNQMKIDAISPQSSDEDLPESVAKAGAARRKAKEPKGTKRKLPPVPEEAFSKKKSKLDGKGFDMKKSLEKFRKLTKKFKGKGLSEKAIDKILKPHLKHNSAAHIANMKKHMLKGDSFEKAHAKALKQVGKGGEVSKPKKAKPFKPFKQEDSKLEKAEKKLLSKAKDKNKLRVFLREKEDATRNQIKKHLRFEIMDEMNIDDAINAYIKARKNFEVAKEAAERIDKSPSITPSRRHGKQRSPRSPDSDAGARAARPDDPPPGQFKPIKGDGKKLNPWLAHVQKTASKYPGMKFKDILKKASKSWKK